MSFDDFGLHADIVRALREQGYENPTPIQHQAIPRVLAGIDIIAGAQTGTGKTAAFSLPLIHRLLERAANDAQAGDARSPSRRRPVRALVLAPTRELAIQIGENVAAYTRHTRLRSTVIFGGVKINPQIDALRQGVDILIATPGRLLDHAQQHTVDLKQVEILVLDEADRMLDMGFIHDIKRVLKLLPPSDKRQNLLFSATCSPEIRKLAMSLMNAPETIEVAPTNATADKVNQVVHRVEKSAKRALLSHLVTQRNWHQVLVFTRTKHGANRLAQQLEKDGISAAAIHGNKSQNARTRALAGFKDGDVRVLVATDIAARGLDIDQLPNVVNYELPNVPEDYIHRIGRTARAGNSGEAVSLVDAEEVKYLKGIERLMKREVPVMPVEDFDARAVRESANDAALDSRSDRREGSRGGNGSGARNGSRGGDRSGARSSDRGNARQAQGGRNQSASLAPARTDDGNGTRRRRRRRSGGGANGNRRSAAA